MPTENSKSKRYYYIQISDEHFFDDIYIKALRRKDPDLVLIFQRLMILSNKNNEPGIIEDKDLFDSLEEQVSVELNEPIEKVQELFSFIHKHKLMIPQEEKKEIIPMAVSLVKSETEGAFYQRGYRKNAKQEKSNDKTVTDGLQNDTEMKPICRTRDKRLETRDKKEEKKKEKKKSTTSERVFSSDCISVICYLNQVTGKNHDPDLDTNQQGIRARLKEGHSVEEMKRVIDFQWKAWASWDKRLQNMNPVTLFRKSNYSRYLEDMKNQHAKAPKDSIYDFTTRPELKDVDLSILDQMQNSYGGTS